MDPIRIEQRHLEEINARFRGAAPEETLGFVHATFGRRAAILTSMQRAGTAICFLADRAGLDFDVLFVDTGVLHQETLRTRDEVARAYPRLRLRTLSPRRTFRQQTAEEGLLYLTKEGQERCCELRKTDPLLAVKGEYDVLVSALRREEGGARSSVLPFTLDPEMNALRVHPFATLPSDELDAMLAKEPGIVVNPLHDMGFLTIGCFPCTTPVRPDETERAGRWRHLAGVEYCGINPLDRGRAGTIDLDSRYTAPLSIPVNV